MKRTFLLLIAVFIASTILAQYQVTIDFSSPISTGSPLVFGATQPRGLSNEQWNVLQQQGFTFARSQADLVNLVPCSSPDDYHNNTNGCANPDNWDWSNGIYGNDFVQKAIDRNMKVCLVVKNATWNRFDGAPFDEETMPKDLEVWQDIVKNIINHYKGGITYLECFNEVDRRPDQFYVTGSGLSAKEGYKKVVKTAIEAANASNYPSTRVGGPAAAGFGLAEMGWLLEDTAIGKDLGCVTFHDFDNPEYPHENVQEIKELLAQYNTDAHIVRSSHTPEFNRNDPMRRPGLTQPEWIAPFIIGALKDGLDAIGFWEIQNKSDANDHRYWFDGNKTVKTANTFILLSNTFKLGKDTSKIYDVAGLPYSMAMGAKNKYDEAIAVFVSKSDAYDISLTIENIEVNNSMMIEVYRGDAVGDGKTVIDSFFVEFENNQGTFDYTIPEKSVIGFRVDTTKQAPSRSTTKEIHKSSNILIFPNPVKEILSLKTEENLYSSSYNIFNSMGAKMDAGIVTNKEIICAGLKSGVYQLQLQTDGNQLVKSFVKL